MFFVVVVVGKKYHSVKWYCVRWPSEENFIFFCMEVKSMIRRGGITHLQKTPTTVCAGEADAQQLTSGKPRQ